ncbi:hypothetical protein DV702_13500 [Sporosarcina sp. PTS2304]|uniref:hypothetical protein n=1 Tax=Sporosarcina sp. PTS2304 TaxID=2283194 RepID=UPI000E0DA5DD|nr:hypothetical protein [Sporosarcina sp. PTS2304]AXI00646.1 hypothetical protein DV702_13500 [Sporosarcina sp. PTS2304]
MIALNYGKYQAPALLLQIIELQEALTNEELLPYGDLLGYFFSLEGLDSRYLNTPLDVISFARTGVDGIHFGFLTDFGQVASLETAYIVRVSPMDYSQPVTLAAKNLRDFLKIIFFYPEAMDMLDSMQVSEVSLATHAIDSNERRVIERIEKLIPSNPPLSFIAYYKDMMNTRRNEVVLSTEDTIGIVSPQAVHTSSDTSPFTLPAIEHMDIVAVQQFFRTASYEEKLAFIRDGQSKGLFFENESLQSYVKKQLVLLGLDDEAKRISYPKTL